MEFVHVELKRDTWMDPGKKVLHPEDAVEEVKRLIGDLDREMLISIHLATDGSVINASVCSIGSINQSIVSLAEIFRTGLVTGAAAFLLVHNHPRGTMTPSKEDLEVTRKCAITGRIMNFHLLDHIIIGSKNQCCSLLKEYPSYFETDIHDFENYEKLLIAERRE